MQQPIIKQLVTALLDFDQEKPLHCQVMGAKEGLWSLGFTLVKLEEDGAAMLMCHHPELQYLPPDCTRQVKAYQCDKGHQFLALPDHPVVMGRVMCPYCAAKGGIIIS